MDEDDEERSFCYVESALVDRKASDDQQELHENVWFKTKPPRASHSTYHPFVSARQIDLVRALLMGKNTLKMTDIPPPDPIPRQDPRKRSLAVDKQISSVRFLNSSIYEYDE